MKYLSTTKSQNIHVLVHFVLRNYSVSVKLECEGQQRPYNINIGVEQGTTKMKNRKARFR